MVFKIIPLSVILFASLLCCACKKDDVLPAITMEGKNTLGFRINGGIWKPHGYGGGSGIGTDMSVPNFLDIWGGNDNSTIHIVLWDTIAIAPKTYVLSNVRRYSASYTIFESGNNDCQYDPENLVNGKLVISKLSSGIISGTFNFKMYNPDCTSDSLRVTDGRFDLMIGS